MSKKPLDPQEGVDIVLERLAHRGAKVRYHKESWFGTLVGRIAYALFGRSFPKGDPMEHGWIICQTIGRTVWLPNNWKACHPRIQFEILLHEERHSFQFEKWGLGSMTLGVLTMGFAYLFLLPVVWTMRARFERDGYLHSMRARFLIGDQPGEGFLGNMLEHFTKRNYVWMWPFPEKVKRWFWRACLRAQHEAKTGVP